MLFRFCLYGFLKNQLYIEPFLVLAFLDRGVSFTFIGLLIGFRELCVNLLEIPSGALADNFGRRGAMIFGFTAYVFSFLLFGLSRQPLWLFPAMFLFSIGETFRSGTHKAIIFSWLEYHGRSAEKTQIYGYTRSWSKIGSLVSVVIAGSLVLWHGDYAVVFLACIPPYLLNIVNFLTYPSYVETSGRNRRGVRNVAVELGKTLCGSWRDSSLRGVLLESMTYEGIYKVTKDYLQPMLKMLALSLPIIMFFEEREQTAVLVAVVYGALYLLSSVASRHAHLVADRFSTPQHATRFLWILTGVSFVLLAAGVVSGLTSLAVIAFIALAVFQNFWRPVLVGRCASLSQSDATATVLSIDSQVRALFTAVLAPLVGWMVDLTARVNSDLRFLPVALIGMLVCVLMLFFDRHNLYQR